MTIRGLIFDYGGVLWDMRWDAARTLEREHGLAERAITETLYGTDAWHSIQVGGGDRDAWQRDAHLELERLAGRGLPPLHQHWRERQHLIGPNIDLVRRLRPPFKTAVLSNADGTLVDRLKHELGIFGLFDDVLCSADVGLAKPDPRVYALAARRLALAPGECLFVDDLASNVDAARAAGMRAVQFLVYEGHSLEAQLAEFGVRPRG